MSLTSLPMNNQATLPMITANSDTLVTITSSSTITTTAISSALGIVNINPTGTISAAATRQDAYFETRLNAMENAIFKLGGTLEKFISINNHSGKLRGESNRGYLTGFSVNTSQFEID